MVASFRELRIWKSGMELARVVYRSNQAFPDTEKFGLVTQMRRAAVSIPANIAEGWARNTRGEFNQALGIALGSAAELETLVELGRDFGYLSPASYEELIGRLKSLRPSILSFKSTLHPRVAS